MSLPAIDWCLYCGGRTEWKYQQWYCPCCGLHFQVHEDSGIFTFGGADSWIMESAEEKRRILENWEKLKAKHPKGPDC